MRNNPTPKTSENIPYEDMTELEQARHRIWGGDGAGMQIHTPQCKRCAWYDRDRPHLARCRVYPRGIPLPILTNQHDHRLPYDGDQGFRFEPIVEN